MSTPISRTRAASFCADDPTDEGGAQQGKSLRPGRSAIDPAVREFVQAYVGPSAYMDYACKASGSQMGSVRPRMTAGRIA